MGKITTTSTMPARSSREIEEQANALVKKEGVERVMCVIDNSGSMDGNFGQNTRMEAVVEAVWAIVDASSRALTNLGLMSFSSAPELLCRITDQFSNVKSSAMRLRPTGGTYYGPALKMALNSEPNRVILLSDGEAGDRTEALAWARKYKEKHIKIDCVAVGDSGVKLLQEIAEITGGTYTFCNNIAKLQETFLKLETRARLRLEHKA